MKQGLRQIINIKFSQCFYKLADRLAIKTSAQLAFSETMMSVFTMAFILKLKKSIALWDAFTPWLVHQV